MMADENGCDESYEAPNTRESFAHNFVQNLVEISDKMPQYSDETIL